MNNTPQQFPDASPRRSFLRRAWARFVTENPASYLFWAFFLPAALMFVLYAALGTFPFGKSSVLVLDLNGQYVHFFEGLRDLVYGEGSFLYSFERAMGGEFLGIYAYYLASPLSYIVCLFPKHAILEALYTMFVIKVGLCGLTFGYYLHRAAKVKGHAATVMFSVMYALCGYCVIYQHNTMWIDCVILLPLVTLGLEELISHRKYLLFTVTLALSILSNFYIGYMVCIYVFAYSVYYYFSRTKEECNPFGERGHFPRAVARVLLFSAIAIAIAAIIILPAVYALTFGKNDFQSPNFSPTQRFDFLDFLSKFFVGSYDTVRPEGLPIVYSGMLALILLPLYFLSSRRSRRERIGTALFAAFFILCFNFNPADRVWHGFALPNWLNYRYSFMFCFVILVAGRKAYDALRDNAPRTILSVCGILGLVLLILQKLELKNMPDFGAVWLSLAFLVIYCIGLSLATRTKARETTAMILCVVVCLEMFCAGLLNLVSLDEDVVISGYNSYHDFYDPIQPLIDEVKAEDSSFYRMEKNIHRNVNDPFALGIRGLSGSTSTLNAETILFLQRMGYSSHSHWSKYLGGTPLSDSLLGVRYLLAKSDDQTVDPLWGEFYKSDADSKYSIYKNPYAMSIAYAVNSDIKDLYFSDPNPAEAYDNIDEEGNPIELIDYKEIYSPFERMNEMVTKMLGDKKTVEVFKKIDRVEITTDNINLSFAGGHKKYTPVNSKADASIDYNGAAQATGTLYAYFPSKYPREVSVSLNGASYGTFFGNETNRILNLGTFDQGEEFRVKLTLKSDDLYLKSGEDYFYYLDEEVYRDVMTRLAQGNLQITSYTERHFEGTVTTTEETGTVFTTIAYDEGWHVTVDGQPVEIYKTLDALIAFDIPDNTPGEHTIIIDYMPDSFVYGCIITGVGILCLVLILIFDKKLRRLLVRVFPADTNPSGIIQESISSDNGNETPSQTEGEEAKDTDIPRPAIIPDEEVTAERIVSPPDPIDNCENNSPPSPENKE